LCFTEDEFSLDFTSLWIDSFAQLNVDFAIGKHFVDSQWSWFKIWGFKKTPSHYTSDRISRFSRFSRFSEGEITDKLISGSFDSILELYLQKEVCFSDERLDFSVAVIVDLNLKLISYFSLSYNNKLFKFRTQ